MKYRCTTFWFLPIPFSTEVCLISPIRVGDVIERCDQIDESHGIYRTHDGHVFPLSQASLEYHFVPIEENNDEI